MTDQRRAQLKDAIRFVILSERNVARQEILIEHLERRGYSTLQARKALATLKTSLDLARHTLQIFQDIGE